MEEETKVNIITLEDILFMNQKNDICFTIDNKFILLLEHQSTINNNMPLRCLLYIAREYEKLIDKTLSIEVHYKNTYSTFLCIV